MVDESNGVVTPNGVNTILRAWEFRTASRATRGDRDRKDNAPRRSSKAWNLVAQKEEKNVLRGFSVLSYLAPSHV